MSLQSCHSLPVLATGPGDKQSRCKRKADNVFPYPHRRESMIQRRHLSLSGVNIKPPGTPLVLLCATEQGKAEDGLADECTSKSLELCNALSSEEASGDLRVLPMQILKSHIL